MNPKVLNAKEVGFRHPNSVYVGRPSDYGNPFTIESEGSRRKAIERFEALVKNNQDFYDDIVLNLRGKNLICWCAPLPCHADVLLRIANSTNIVTEDR